MSCAGGWASSLADQKSNYCESSFEMAVSKTRLVFSPWQERVIDIYPELLRTKDCFIIMQHQCFRHFWTHPWNMHTVLFYWIELQKHFKVVAYEMGSMSLKRSVTWNPVGLTCFIHYQMVLKFLLLLENFTPEWSLHIFSYTLGQMMF